MTRRDEAALPWAPFGVGLLLVAASLIDGRVDGATVLGAVLVLVGVGWWLVTWHDTATLADYRRDRGPPWT